jgi:hypothetical protein
VEGVNDTVALVNASRSIEPALNWRQASKKRLDAYVGSFARVPETLKSIKFSRGDILAKKDHSAPVVLEVDGGPGSPAIRRSIVAAGDLPVFAPGTAVLGAATRHSGRLAGGFARRDSAQTPSNAVWANFLFAEIR